jgi:hypothetical protein
MFYVANRSAAAATIKFCVHLDLRKRSHKRVTDHRRRLVRMMLPAVHWYLPGGDPQTPRYGGGAGRSATGPSPVTRRLITSAS